MQGIINIKGKDYMLISERVRIAHTERESFEILESAPIQVGPMWVWQAVILVDGKRYIGTAEIKFDASPKTADGTNPVACAETSAVGRALAMAGIGSVDSIASAEEVLRAQSEQERAQPVKTYDNDAPASPQQLDTIQKLSKQLGQDVGDLSAFNFGECAQLLKELSAQLNAKRKAS